LLFEFFFHWKIDFAIVLVLKDQYSGKKSCLLCWYSESSWKMEHFLFLLHVLNRCSFRDNCVWNLNLCTCFRCNTQKIQKSLYITTKTWTQIQNFKHNFLENYNDSEHAVKINNTPFFMNFLNTNKNWQLFPHWTGRLTKKFLKTILSILNIKNSDQSKSQT
jgi:hypothetical protein